MGDARYDTDDGAMVMLAWRSRFAAFYQPKCLFAMTVNHQETKPGHDINNI